MEYNLLLESIKLILYHLKHLWNNSFQVFHDFGIDVISYMNPVKQECPEVKYEVNDSSYDDINDTYDDFNDTKPLSKFKKKRGKAKGKYYVLLKYVVIIQILPYNLFALEKNIYPKLS